MNRIYFDNAATTRVLPQVLDKMLPFLSGIYGNPSSIHDYGRKARVAVEEAREVIAEFINADASEIYFVSNGTEANNFPVSGIANINRIETSRDQIITTKVEHNCVLEIVDKLSANGFETNKITVDKNCILNSNELKKSLSDKTSLVSVIHINNETGSINDLESLSGIVHEHGSYFHSDTVQSFGKSPIDVKKMGVDSISASAHKIGGPKGIGFTYVKAGTPMEALILGGSQERNRRGGTENVPGIIGMAEAVKLAKINMESNSDHISNLRANLINGIKNIDGAGIAVNCESSKFPYITSFSLKSNFYKTDAEAMLMFLDINGLAVSNGAACTSGTLKPSHVIKAMGYDDSDANGTIRVSFSTENTLKEVESALDILSKLCGKFRL